MPAVMATTVDYQRTTVELLQRIAREELPGLIVAAEDAGRFIPRHVERTVERFLGCGDPRGVALPVGLMAEHSGENLAGDDSPSESVLFIDAAEQEQCIVLSVQAMFEARWARTEQDIAQR
jgi:hypothetical protein